MWQSTSGQILRWSQIYRSKKRFYFALRTATFGGTQRDKQEKALFQGSREGARW